MTKVTQDQYNQIMDAMIIEFLTTAMFEKLISKKVPCAKNLSESVSHYIWEKLRQFEIIEREEENHDEKPKAGG